MARGRYRSNPNEFLDPLELERLNALSYSVVGTGGYTRRLLRLLKSRGLRLPERVLSTDEQSGTLEGIPMIPLTHAEDRDLEQVVLGSDVFQRELIGKVRAHLPESRCIDVADDVQAEILGIAPCAMPRTPNSDRYSLLITLAASGPMRIWLGNLSNWLASKAVPLIVRHPMEPLPDDLLRNAAAILVWNGVSSHFDAFVSRTRQLGLAVTYVESGFFPQREHFYLDRQGVNASSQLMRDSLDWLDSEHLATMRRYRETLFGDCSEQRQDGGIFIPLQVQSDSNVQLNSRFRNGMQSYIDFIAAEHPRDKLVFKPHPKDFAAGHYHYHHGSVSTEETSTLISRARLVRGINSAVLFEAVLAGKAVVSDGNSLLNHPCGDPLRVICAMIARQFHVAETTFSPEKLSRFSYLGALPDTIP